jgi:coenzyme F420-dependent glucose-6-phosphate dehydrogenase
MGLVESVQSLLWARRRQPNEVMYGVGLAHERFRPDELLRQAVVAEEAGFDIVAGSDHLKPWWEDGQPAPANAGNVWVWLGAVSQATSEPSIGTAVTGMIHRYNPVVVAQQIATLEILAPGRAFLGVGSSEAMNEMPTGLGADGDYPSIREQQERMRESVTIVRHLLDGETVDFDGKYFKTRNARLYSLPERRPPIFMSAFGEHAAELAGRLADGVWTLADPRQAPTVIAGYRRGAEQAGREPGEIILQGMFSWAEDDETALESSKEWKATIPLEHYTEPIDDPAEIQAHGREISDKAFKASAVISSDPKDHLRRVELIRAMGATAVVMMNSSGADPEGALRMYGEHVLPKLRN